MGMILSWYFQHHRKIHVDPRFTVWLLGSSEDPLDGTLSWEPRGDVDVAYTDLQVLAVDTQGASDVLLSALNFNAQPQVRFGIPADNYWADRVPSWLEI